jgi:ElaA protein
VAGSTFVPTVRAATIAQLDAATLYKILRLRVDVFVVEQQCPYPELDGRDLETTARQLWIEDGAGEITATLRVVREPDGTARIGRVATAASARGAGLAATLMSHALERIGDGDAVLDAQEHLEAWYGRFGFERSGPSFVEDGIPHVPMRRRLGSEG